MAKNLEERVRFELTTLRICNPLHWASLPPLHILYYNILPLGWQLCRSSTL